MLTLKVYHQKMLLSQSFRVQNVPYDIIQRCCFPGEVRMLSSLHETGQYLDRLTGVAALLRFPMPELDGLCESDEEEDDDDEFPQDQENTPIPNINNAGDGRAV